MPIYHVESNDIFEGYLARLVLCDEVLINPHRRRACWETENEGVLFARRKGFDPILTSLAQGSLHRRFFRHTYDILGNVC